MKLPCKIVEDMLPIYYDGVCSEESAMLIEEHLKNCTQCSRLLTDLHTEIEMSEKPVDDLKPLVRIQKKWKKSKRVYYAGEKQCQASGTFYRILYNK